jgi:hypothetical protein
VGAGAAPGPHLHAGARPAHPSEVTIDFSDDRVDLAHGGWTEANAGDRKKFSDWPQILDRYASLANRQ